MVSLFSQSRHIILFLLLICVVDVYGQRRRNLRAPTQRFELELIGGMNFSQVDGDYFTGFDQKGFYGGIQVNGLLSSRSSIVVGMLYSQKGSIIPHGTQITSNTRNDRNIRLNYIEVPILFRTMLKRKATGAFVELGGGLARLSSVSIQERDRNAVRGTVYNDISSQFRKTDAMAIVGMGFTVADRYKFSLRYSQSLIHFYDNEEYELPNPLSGVAKEVEFLRNYHIALTGSYRIW